MSDGRVTMDFFDSQHSALRRTSWLVFLFIVAVLLIILAVHSAIAGTFAFQSEGTFSYFFLNARLFFWTGGITSLLIIGGTLAKIIELREGGSSVALMMGGVPVAPDTSDPDERKLLNVVEEMALASGCPVPAVYLLPREMGINAFAAGFSVSDAAIGVTLGAIQLLSRDELQGVIAHEFSHIINGDMRLNIKLIGVLNGILLIGVLGMSILRGVFEGAMFSGATSHRRRSSSDDSKGGGGVIIVIIVVAVLLTAIGYIGVFFGRVIKSAVSRQREFLADAAAVQYTRNPQGISGALMKIGGFSSHGQIKNRHAEELSHMFFENVVQNFDLMATHPPVQERIKLVYPKWDGTFPKVELPKDPVRHYGGQAASAPTNPLMDKMDMRSPEGMIQAAIIAEALREKNKTEIGNDRRITANAAVARVGTIPYDALDYTRDILDAIPQELKDRAHKKTEVTALVFALFISGDSDGIDKELAYLRETVTEGLYEKVESALELLVLLDSRVRLPLVELSISMLRALSPQEKDGFMDVLQGLIMADGKMFPFEFALERVIVHAVYSQPRKTAQLYSINAVANECSLVLSALAYGGAPDGATALMAFEKGRKRLSLLGENLKFLQEDQCKMEIIGAALDRLALTTPHIRKSVLEASAAVILADEAVKVTEVELLRAVSASLDCPMPPIV